jgi:xylan 1,4-beta-xylosidase
MVTRRGTAVSALAVYYPEEVSLSVPASFGTRDVAERTLATGQPKSLNLGLAGLTAPPTPLEVVDARHGWAMAEWTRQGRDADPSMADIHAIRAEAGHGAVTWHTVSDAGVLDVEVRLQPWAIALLSQVR